MEGLSKKENAILKMALEYWLDGQSLDGALAASERKYKESLIKKRNMSEESAKKVSKALVQMADMTTNRIEKANREHRKKEENLDKKSHKKRNNTATSEHKKGLNARAANHKTMLAQEETREKASAQRKKTFLAGFQNFPGKVGTIASYGAAILILNSVRQAFVYAIEKAIEFEEVFTDLQVKSGFTAEQMALVSESIYEVAASTKFMTVEMVQAATTLGRFGFEADEVANILPNVGNVAAATGEQLGTVAEVFGKVLNAYQYTADQAGVVADQLVYLFNNSALNLEKFNTAFSYVGSAAASTGTGLVELTSAMAVLADRGVTASKIGTGLRNIFTKLGTSGETLTDILRRVNDEQLAFYEVAELVGRRAANQLFILAGSMDDLAEKSESAMDAFGESLKAAAIQMDTFNSKWKTFVNNVTNTIAPDFDPDGKWQDQLYDSIDFLDLINAKFFDDKPVFDRIAYQYSEFVDDVIAEKKRLEAEGKLSSDAVAIKSLKAKEKAKGDNRNNDYIFGLNAVQDLLTYGEDGVSEAYERKQQKEIDDRIKKQEIAFKESFLTLSERVRLMGHDVYNEFLKEYNETGTIIDKVIEEGGNDKGLANLVSTVQRGTTEDREELKKFFSGIREVSDDLDVDHLTKKYLDYQDKIRKINHGKTEIFKQTNAAYRADITRFKSERQAIEKQLCADHPSAAAELGIECETKKSRSRGEFGRFNLNEEDKQAYRVEKDKLSKQYRAEKDPVLKAQINDKLYALEDEYQNKTTAQFEAYLDEMGRLRDEFVRKYPDQAGAYDRNIENVKRAQIKSDADRDVNRNTYENRDLDLKIKRWKKESDAREDYLLEMAVLENEYQGEKSYNKRQKIIDKQNALSEKFYAEEIARVHEYYDELDKAILAAEEYNTLQYALGGPEETIDLTAAYATSAKRSTDVKKVNVEGEKAKKEQRDKDDWQDVNWSATAISTVNAVYDIYSELGDMKLELLKEQTQRELELIGERFDSEKAIRDSALESGIISQEDAIAAEERANKKRIQKENAANKKLFEAQQKKDKQDAIFKGLSSIAQAVATAFATNIPPVAAVMAAIATATIGASTALNLKAINQRKFVPKKYAEGGLVEGRSHSQGGVPFTVAGQGGYEMEGGEFVVNKEATKKHLAELERINGKTKRTGKVFAEGGYVDVYSENNDAMALLIEELGKPVRAYVTDQDLANSQSEREALTKKVSY